MAKTYQVIAHVLEDEQDQDEDQQQLRLCDLLVKIFGDRLVFSTVTTDEGDEAWP